jgi:molecular chaperone DnaK
MTQIMSKAVGIDLGTTNSAVAMLDPTDTEILIHRDPVSKSPTTPSCVWRNPATGELVVGRKALIRVGNPPEPIRSIKRLMGQRSTVSVSGKEMSPEEVSAAILGEMKRQIEEDTANLATADTSWLVDRAIVTVPAYFDQPQIDATRRAAEMTGLEVLDLLHEPTAAACYHCWRTKTRDGTFLVYDLGGGTFDVSVVRCTAGVYEVLGISGNNRLGGDDIDTALARHLQDLLQREGWALDLDLTGDPEDRLRFDLLKSLAEGAKKALSGSSEYLLRDAGRLRDKEGNPVIIEAVIERSELDATARPLIERTLPYCQEALARAEQKAGVTLGDVDQVILAGGSTHMPLVRDLVTSELCAGARCAEPLYEKVDTIVALGAAIRASVVGGLAVYDAERTVRVSFRGMAAASETTTHVGGTVEALAEGVDLTGGSVRLTAQHGEIDESDVSPSGAFAFRRVPLEPGSETQLGFEIFDEEGRLRAAVGRAVIHSDDAASRLPGPSNVAITAKAVLLEVSRGGRTHRKELVPALEELPTSAEFTFSHPGDTETVLFPLYQQSKKIQVISVPVPSTTPRGTPIRFDLHMDRHSFITVRGNIGEHEFQAAVELPPTRELPTDDEVAALQRTFEEATAYLSAGERNTVQIRHGMARDAFEAARRSGDRDQAVHEFEQMEEIVAGLGHRASALEPPKHEFDQLVDKCIEYNTYLGQVSGEVGVPHDGPEMARSIEVQRVEGERAFKATDQKSYGDAFRQLTGYRDHLSALVQRAAPPGSEPSDGERAVQTLEVAQRESETVRQLAVAAGRADLRDKVDELRARLDTLGTQVAQDPVRVREKAQELRLQLGQYKTVLTAVPTARSGKLVDDHSRDRGA